MTKKSHQKFLADENREIFREKVTFLKFSTESEKFSKIGGKSETGRKMHHGLRGMDAPGRSERVSIDLAPIKTKTRALYVLLSRQALKPISYNVRQMTQSMAE